jgi:hypothetical protein
MDSTGSSSATEAIFSDLLEAPIELGGDADVSSLLSIEDVQKYLNRSRASVYRYANTDPEVLNLPYDPKKLNPEIRRDKDDVLKFRPQEVQRFAEEVLGLKPTIQVQAPADTVTQGLLREILQELKAIHQLLQHRDSGSDQ